MYANSGDFYPKLLIERPYLHTVLALLITHWRVPHFYAMHRFLHPWRLKNFPDIGRFMYKHIHSLHHKSYNPTTLSGTSFHPVESMMYYSACFLVAPFSVHITIPVGCIIDCGIGAWLGHDGFMAPGVGDQFHQLHHESFDCNYGAQHVPLDWLFGTYAEKDSDVPKIWRASRQKVDAEGDGNADEAGQTVRRKLKFQ